MVAPGYIVVGDEDGVASPKFDLSKSFSSTCRIAMGLFRIAFKPGLQFVCVGIECFQRSLKTVRRIVKPRDHCIAGLNFFIDVVHFFSVFVDFDPDIVQFLFQLLGRAPFVQCGLIFIICDVGIAPSKPPIPCGVTAFVEDRLAFLKRRDIPCFKFFLCFGKTACDIGNGGTINGDKRVFFLPSHLFFAELIILALICFPWPPHDNFIDNCPEGRKKQKAAEHKIERGIIPIFNRVSARFWNINLNSL